ncbi:UNKNOWN [Stylonychia lemnae]|uniref:Uncharacterized protein n=1 Tax=Stylonychia lemnae TaxID=5949 RepID=A0A078B0P1_STYLE|nr:UNKNOWN [Stylonychia lemnae]|eukprot:CDW86917.1 UNKNOWN [Stylonychia lemnae]
MLVGTGGFIYQQDQNLMFIKVESVTVRKVKAMSHAVFNMNHILNMMKEQYAMKEQMACLLRTVFLEIVGSHIKELLSRLVLTNTKIKDLTNLKNITAYNIEAKMYGGFLYNEQKSYLEFSIITIQDSKDISNISSQQGGFAYIKNPQTNITLKNIEFKNISSQIQGGIFYVVDSDMISIENSKFKEFSSTIGGFISSSSFLMRLQIIASTIICDKDYNQESEIDQLSGCKHYFEKQQFLKMWKIILRRFIFALKDYPIRLQINIQRKFWAICGNVAQTGGVIYGVSNSNISISYCTIQKNQAIMTAGAIYLNSIDLLNDETLGSFIFLIFDVRMDIDNCEFKNGASNLGGSFFQITKQILKVEQSTPLALRVFSLEKGHNFSITLLLTVVRTFTSQTLLIQQL